ncbi:MAG: hypothetical protein ACRDWF_05535 [Acidimicrobiia bacterium]
MKVTLDTMVVWEWLKYERAVEELNQLIQLHESGTIELAVTATIHRDIYHGRMAERLEALPDIGVEEVGGVARVGSWMIGRDLLADETFAEWSEVLESPGTADFDHLHAHMLNLRDFFLTIDKGILDLAGELSTRFGIEVRTPAAFLELCLPSGSSGTDEDS